MKGFGRLLTKIAGRSNPALRRLMTVFVSTGAALALASNGQAQQQSSFRPPAGVPKAWIEFAGDLRGKAEALLKSDDPQARKLRAALDEVRNGGDAQPLQVAVRVWIARDGRVERVDFGSVSETIDPDLKSLLLRVATPTPPADMLQPVHLKLSLEPRSSPQ
ncbi:hypothetical protein [Hyphomicrobium sp. 2TAF46]|uniref:hypothetical protein n=1 Tax=Hyphomicrobium sp. 2TAF46 TaxID=3233019 RepID=UPI003F8FF27C